MARKKRNNVDYFPHSVTHGKKMFYLRDKYGNDGYAVWFMLLEELGKSEYHYLDLKDPVSLMYLSSQFKVTEDILNEIIECLVKFGEFDQDLWISENILFNQKFVENIKDAYKKRSNECIDKNSLLLLLEGLGRSNEVKSNRKPRKSILKGSVNPQSKEEYSKEEESKEEYTKEKEIIFPFDSDNFKEQWTIWKQYKKDQFRFIYKTQISEQAALKHLANISKGIEIDAIEIIHNALAQGWKGLFELKKQKNGKQTPNGKFKTVSDDYVASVINDLQS